MKDQALYDKMVKRVSIDPATGCWNWTGFVHSYRKYPGNRYGGVTVYSPVTKKCRAYTTHRAMWLAIHGEPEKGKCVCHTCDNPICLNPEHLWLGTRRENTMDMVKKNRHHLKKKTHCKRGHILYGDNLFTDSRGYRHCNECCKLRQRVKWHSDPAFRERQRLRRRERYARARISAGDGK